jgi:hypothetical protein
MHTDDIMFRTTTVEKAAVKHYLLYPAAPMAISEFVQALKTMTWCPCTAVVGHSDITLVDFDEAVEGQPSFSSVDALHVLQAYYDSTALDPMELLHLAGAQYEIAASKKPIHYLRLPTLQRLLRVLESYEPPIVYLVHERHKNVCRLLRKAIIWVRSSVTASCAALVT